MGEKLTDRKQGEGKNLGAGAAALVCSLPCQREALTNCRLLLRSLDHAAPSESIHIVAGRVRRHGSATVMPISICRLYRQNQSCRAPLVRKWAPLVWPSSRFVSVSSFLSFPFLSISFFSFSFFFSFLFLFFVFVFLFCFFFYSFILVFYFFFFFRILLFFLSGFSFIFFFLFFKIVYDFENTHFFKCLD